MPINLTILQAHLNPTLVETGTLHGDAVAMALNAGFGKVWTVEYDAGLAAAAKSKFHGKPVTCLAGDSGAAMNNIVPQLTGPVTFWLDAHPPGEMLLFQENLPLVRELSAIALRAAMPGDVVLIDDMRLFSGLCLSQLAALLKLLWPGCEVDRIDSPVATGDIMRCRPFI